MKPGAATRIDSRENKKLLIQSKTTREKKNHPGWEKRDVEPNTKDGGERGR